MPYHQAVRRLGDLVSTRALERVIESAAQDRGLQAGQLTQPQLADILKRDVFRRLQATVPASLAKRRIEEVLNELSAQTPGNQTPGNQIPAEAAQDVASAANTPSAEQTAQIASLEDSLKSYSLYFDWPEVKRLRALVGVLRSELELGKHLPPKLLLEGDEIREGLAQRLAEALVVQESDLADLRAGLVRVEGVGGPKVRRLGGLIQSIEAAQKSGALLPSEVDRARSLTLDLRKLVASSVVGLTADGGPAVSSDETVQRLREMDRAHELRALADLSRDFTPLLRVDPASELEMQAAKERLEGGHLLGEERFVSLRSRLETSQGRVLDVQKGELAALETRLAAFDASHRPVQQAQLSAAVARGLLDSGSLATDELRLLGRSVPVLERAGGESAEDALESQRELIEIEQAARDLPVIEGLQGDLASAASALERGENADLSALWAVIDQRKGQAAQEREGFDTRARSVLDEYSQYRHLAGETISQLGRLADTLRAHLNLKQLSAEGRARYVQVLGESEAMLGEARAEFETARNVTAQFGEDALAGLLDVFSFSESDAPIVTLPPLPEGLWELRGGTVLRGAPDPQAWSLARLSAQLAELPDPIGNAEVRLDTAEGVWLLMPHAGGHRATRGENMEQARDRHGLYPD
ncbi:hypothetical protein [Deinococcus sp.]|uniref:hypothetical protein n=1 Tax=Deinococcus sp. TaxID=47478 RepID=UPI0025E479F8|nr:hypothetical protein [Deinococcus sp.]